MVAVVVAVAVVFAPRPAHTAILLSPVCGALQAVHKEAEALRAAHTWDESTVIEKDQLVARARASGETIHLGELMSICSIKHHELDKQFHKHKGRVVYRGDITKDQDGKAAVFTLALLHAARRCFSAVCSSSLQGAVVFGPGSRADVRILETHAWDDFWSGRSCPCPKFVT